MQANSKEIESSQDGIHPRLIEYVKKHLDSNYQKPIQKFSAPIFSEVIEIAEASGLPLILDSGCGVGESTINLAKLHPNSFIIGIDKSKARIEKQSSLRGENYLIVRADLIDFWRQAVAANWKLEKHYILYPNPWPKPEHLQRRWHAHPVFPSILELGGEIEVRSNWKIYIDEFAEALSLKSKQMKVEAFKPKDPITLFEKKYLESGHQLFRGTVAK